MRAVSIGVVIGLSKGCVCRPPADGMPTPIDTGAAKGTGDTSSTAAGTADTAHALRAWVEVSASACARDSDGWVECWNQAPPPGLMPTGWWAPIPPSPYSVRSFAVGVRNATGMHDGGPQDGRLDLWSCGSTSGDPNPTPRPQCLPPANVDFVSFGPTSGLEANGSIWMWSVDHATPITPFLGLAPVLHAGPSDRVVAMTADNQVRAATQYEFGHWTNFDGQLPADVDIVEIAPAGLGVCGLDTAGVVHCVGAEFPPLGFQDPVSFPNPPYVQLAAGLYHTCARRADDVIECNDGTVLDFGPLRDMDVASKITWLGPNVPSVQPNPRMGLAVCVITTDNAVRCHGDYFQPDLHPMLPQGDGTQPP